VARRLLIVACALACALACVAWAPVPRNPADRLADTSMDPMRYDPATHCVKHETKGIGLLQYWLEGHVRGESWGVLRCEKWGKKSASLHSEGRAIDWHLDARVKADRLTARNLIRLLLAPDRTGQPFALARRMGVQGIIWNCHAWWGGEQLVPYSVCYDKRGKRRRKIDRTQGHMDHVHIELNRAGAGARTSFWLR
jgi:hypothetical protein